MQGGNSNPKMLSVNGDGLTETMHKIWCKAGVPNIFEPVGTCEILMQHDRCRNKMAAIDASIRKSQQQIRLS